MPRLPRLPRPRRRAPRPAPRGTLRWRLRRRARPLLDLLDDLGYALRRTARRLRGGVTGPWLRRSPGFRRRAAAVALILGVYAVLRFIALPGVPCELSPAEECPSSASSSGDAMALVPRDAYVYVDADLDRSSDQFELAADLADRLPHFEAILQGSFQLISDNFPLDLQRDLAPWIGDEAAIALVPGAGGEAEILALLQVGDEDGAESFLRRIGGPRPRSARVRGIELSDYGDGVASARLGDFVAFGARPAVEAAIEADRGEGSLQGSEGATEALGDLPEARVAEAYVSDEGIGELLADRGGIASQLDTFVNFGASRGFAVAAVAGADGLELVLESALDPGRAGAGPSFFAAFPPFDPGLVELLPEDALGYLGIADPGETVELLLEQASGVAPGVAEAFDRLNRDLERAGGVDLREGLLPLLEGEAAVGAVPGEPFPYLVGVFSGVDEERVRAALARLQAPLIEALGPGRTGRAPSFREEEVEGVTVRSVRLSPALDIAFAVFDGRVVVSNNPEGVRRVIEGGESLTARDEYRTVTADAPSSPAALLFLDLGGLVRLAEPIGLAQFEPYLLFREDVAKLRALGLMVSSSEDRLSTRMFVEIQKPKETDE